MNYWWVNHKQTFLNEVNGGYIWSPQRKTNGGTNETYENLRKAKPGDVIFSYAALKIAAVGVVATSYIDAEKPDDFGKAGDAWDKNGWLVPINWTKLTHPFFPKNHLADITGLLPQKYSPIQANGNGNQGVYLAHLSETLGKVLLEKIATQNNQIHATIDQTSDQISSDLIENEIENNESINPTFKTQLIKSRRGQGIFRSNVCSIENACRITGIQDQRFLIASHIKPWRLSNDKERLDGNNGLMLSPHIDQLFDKGFISFQNNGELMVSEEISASLLKSWGIPLKFTTLKFNNKQINYLEFHRNEIFKR